jgi:AcrR family transcriptional regulator
MTTIRPAKTTRPAHHRTTLGMRQKKETRARIIESAIPVFAQYGPDAPVVNDFIQAAGIARGTFYNYFQTTRELLDAVLAALSDDLIAAIVPVVATMPNPIIRLATAARIFYRKATADPLLGRFLSSVSGVGTLANERVHADLGEALKAGLIGVPDLDLAHAVATGIMVFALKSTEADQGSDARGLEIVRAILNGLGVSPALVLEALGIQLPAG